MSNKNSVTILGIGNILLQDEGFGVHFVRWFSSHFRGNDEISIVDGGTLGYALLDIVCSCRNLIVVDVIKVEDKPGSLFRFSRREMETHLSPPTSAHEVTFADVLFKAELLGELPAVVFLCIVPQECGNMGMEMTPVMYAKFPAVEQLLQNELNRLKVGVGKNDNA